MGLYTLYFLSPPKFVFFFRGFLRAPDNLGTHGSRRIPDSDRECRRRETIEVKCLLLRFRTLQFTEEVPVRRVSPWVVPTETSGTRNEPRHTNRGRGTVAEGSQTQKRTRHSTSGDKG